MVDVKKKKKKKKKGLPPFVVVGFFAAIGNDDPGVLVGVCSNRP